MRIFTPFAELPFAGHPSVGAAHTLVRTGRLPAGTVRQECGVGVLDLVVDDDGATLTGGEPTLGSERPAHALATALGSAAEDVAGVPAHMAGCGLPWTYLAVRRDAVDRAVPDHAALDALGAGEGISVLSWDAADRDRLRPRLRRRPAVGRGPGDRLGRARRRGLAGGHRPAAGRRGRRRTRSARARSWAGRRCCPAPSPRPAVAAVERHRPRRRRPDRERPDPGPVSAAAHLGGVGAPPSRRPRDVALIAVAVVGISLSGPLTALVAAPAAGHRVLAQRRRCRRAAAGAAPPRAGHADRPAAARPAQLRRSPGCSWPPTSPPGCPACR